MTVTQQYESMDFPGLMIFEYSEEKYTYFSKNKNTGYLVRYENIYNPKLREYVDQLIESIHFKNYIL